MDTITTPPFHEQQDQSNYNKCSYKRTLYKVVLVSVIVSTVVGFLSGYAANRYGSTVFGGKNSIGSLDEKKHGKDSASLKMSPTIAEEDSAIINVVDSSEKSVVSIVISKDVPVYRDMFGSPFGLFFEQPDDLYQQNGQTKKKIGGGTGFFVTQDGMIVTNKHVVEDTGADYTVLLSDGSEHVAKVLARDPIRDVALIKIDGDNYPILSFGDSDTLKVGQTVIAIGNSLGEFSNSVSRGIVSGLQRDIVAGSGSGSSEQLNNIIQTDAAINPGNSGGPLLDISGKVVGMNTAVAQGAENVGFALPINSIKNTIEQVQKNGKISTPYIGVRYIPINKQIQQSNDIAVDYGALVLRGKNVGDLAVLPGSPADKAGIVENDIILEVNGKKITEKNSLETLLAAYNVGDSITLKVLHRGEEKSIQLTLEERKAR